MKLNEDGTVMIEEEDLKNDVDVVETEGVDNEKLKQDLRTTIAKKQAWRSKAIDSVSGKTFKELYAESINKQTTITTEKKLEVPELTENALKDIASLKTESQKRVFQYAHKLSPEQVDELFSYAKGAGIEPKVALEKPFMKKILEQLKTDEENTNASLSPSRRAPVQIGGKSFKDMTIDERRKAFPLIAKGR